MCPHKAQITCFVSVFNCRAKLAEQQLKDHKAAVVLGLSFDSFVVDLRFEYFVFKMFCCRDQFLFSDVDFCTVQLQWILKMPCEFLFFCLIF